MLSYAQCTPQDVADYTNAHDNTLSNLFKIQTELQNQANVAKAAGNFGLASILTAQAAQVQKNVDAVQGIWAGWMYQGVSIAAPTPATLATVQNLTAKVSSILAGVASAQALVNVAAEVLQTFTAV